MVNEMFVERVKKVLIFEKFCRCLEPWQGSILAGIFSVATSMFDLLWSIANLLEEDKPFVFYLLFFLTLESIIFLIASAILFIGLVKKIKSFLVPWMIISMLDVTLALTISLLELSIPRCLGIDLPTFLQNRNNGAPCLFSVVAFLVTVAVCVAMLYGLLAVYTQFQIYNETSSRVTKIKIIPAAEPSDEYITKPTVQDLNHLNTEIANIATIS